MPDSSTRIRTLELRLKVVSSYILEGASWPVALSVAYSCNVVVGAARLDLLSLIAAPSPSFAVILCINWLSYLSSSLNVATMPDKGIFSQYLERLLAEAMGLS